MKLRLLAILPFLVGSIPAEAQERTVVCHAPPNNPRALRTAEVRVALLRLHMAHGDTLGPCGCESDDVCPTGTFCESPRGLCGAGGRCRVLRDPCPCPQVRAPVCGCDGRTYRNSCEARCAGVSILNPGGPCCQDSRDCRPVRIQCGACECGATPLAAPDPRCDPADAVTCSIDPCHEATAVCRDGDCVTAGGFCGGPEGFMCPAGRVCLDDPRDGCDPIFGESCAGVCAGSKLERRDAGNGPATDPDAESAASSEPAPTAE